MTKLHPRDSENRQENGFSERRFSGKTVTTGWMGKRGFISANNALLVSLDLIGEKNQVILEYRFNYFFMTMVTEVWNVGQGHKPSHGISRSRQDEQLVQVWWM